MTIQTSGDAWSRKALLLGLCLGQFACGGGWRAVPIVPPGPPDPTKRVEVWIAGRPLVLHGVAVDQSDISGIPYFRPLGCDTCRISVPRAAVDSMRVGDPPAGFWKTLALTAGGALVAILVVCAASSTCDLGD